MTKRKPRTVHLTTRISADLWQGITDYLNRFERESDVKIARSEAVRHLLRVGLLHHGIEVHRAD